MSGYTALAPHGTTLDKTHMKVLVNMKEKDDQSSSNVDIRGSLCIQHADATATFSKQLLCFALQILE